MGSYITFFFPELHEQSQIWDSKRHVLQHSLVLQTGPSASGKLGLTGTSEGLRHSPLPWGQLPGLPFSYPQSYDDEEVVLVNNKCKCVTVTSKFVPSKENPEEEILERNIRIICKKCDPIEIELGGEIYNAQQSTSCDDTETCYTYNRDKCYTTTFPFLYHGERKILQAALTPASCYAE
uniref:Joining chain of multimeric IgA and IgM n=1 Tax=Nothoprocta perdicaria TaxID=30464 RepID=A0A8C6ZDA2_NOTPE